jgi:transposase
MAKAEDPKVAALRAQRSLNPRPGRVVDERFAESEFLDARDLVQVKYEMVRRVRVDGDTVTRSAQEFGFSRPAFYEAQAALEEGGLAGLVPARPGPRGAHKLTGEVVAFARERLAADASLRPRDLVDAIAERFAIRVHPRSIERALARESQTSGEEGDR